MSAEQYRAGAAAAKAAIAADHAQAQFAALTRMAQAVDASAHEAAARAANYAEPGFCEACATVSTRAAGAARLARELAGEFDAVARTAEAAVTAREGLRLATMRTE